MDHTLTHRTDTHWCPEHGGQTFTCSEFFVHLDTWHRDEDIGTKVWLASFHDGANGRGTPNA